MRQPCESHPLPSCRVRLRSADDDFALVKYPDRAAASARRAALRR